MYDGVVSLDVSTDWDGTHESILGQFIPQSLVEFPQEARSSNCASLHLRQIFVHQRAVHNPIVATFKSGQLLLLCSGCNRVTNGCM